MNDFQDALLAIEASESLEAIRLTVRTVAGSHGYDRVVLFSFSTAEDELVDGVYWAEGHWFDEDEALDVETYVRHCPLTRHFLEIDEPFFWTKTGSGTSRRYHFVETPRGPGLHGLQVPIFGHTGLAGAACFGGEDIDASPRSRLGLTQLGVTAFLAARKLLETPKAQGEAQLSKREIEVLQWIAAGKRGADVAATLGLSVRTVENHLRRIRERLRVKTTAQAISAATRLGILDG